MALHADATALTATGDTTETTIGTVTLSGKARRIIGIGCYAVAGAAMTTAESVTGLFRIDSPDLNLAPMKFPLDVINILTSGAIALKPTVWPVDISVKGLEKLEWFVTMDMAQTGALKGRGFVLYEGD